MYSSLLPWCRHFGYSLPKRMRLFLQTLCHRPGSPILQLFKVQINSRSPVLQARTIPSPIVTLLKINGPNRCHVVIDYSLNSINFHGCSEYLWFVDRLILRGPFGKNDVIKSLFKKKKKTTSYGPVISCLVKWNSVLCASLSLISSALRFPSFNIFPRVFDLFLFFFFFFFFFWFWP